MKEVIKTILREGLIIEQRIPVEIVIPDDIIQIKDIFIKNNYKLYVVGGAIRDAILKKPIKDYDLATDATPDVVEEMMNEAGLKTLPTGKAFGVINVFTDQGEYEIATFRGEKYTDDDKRRPESVFFSDIETDSARRDITINALYYDIDTKEVIDLVGGVNDLKNGIIRAVGNPEDRFNEDKLRIMRSIRFTARFGSDLDPSIDAALKKDASLDGISGERIRDEFIKGLNSAKSTKHFLELINKYGLFDWIFKGLNVNKRFIEDNDYIVIISTLLFNNDLNTLAKKLNDLKYSIDEVRKITTLIFMLDLDINSAPRLKKLFTKSGLSINQLKKFGSIMGIMNPILVAFEKYLKLPNVTGQEAMEKYKIEKPGPELGKAINDMEIIIFQKLL